MVVFAGRTDDPEGVGEELTALLGGRAAAVRKGIRKTGEAPPRYAITDVIELFKGPGNAPDELGRLRSRYPEVFAKEVGRVRERHGDKITGRLVLGRSATLYSLYTPRASRQE